MKVNEKNFFVTGIFGLALVFLMALTGCGGSPGTDYDALVQLLPNHDGADFTADEQDEAVDFAVDSMLEMEAAVFAVAGGPSPSILPGRAVANGTYSGNGITVNCTASQRGNTVTMTYKATFDGTKLYNGYSIEGTGLDIKVVMTSNQNGAVMNYSYGCVYTVSKNGKGMKVVQTGNMTMKQDNSGATMSYNMHFKIYDNNNTVLFNYDYKDTVDV